MSNTDVSTPNPDQMALAQGKNFVWHELYVPSSEAAIEFYTNALDFGTATMPMGEMGDYTMLTRDGQPICGVMATTGSNMEGVPPHWSTFLAVDDVDARIAKVEELGGKLMHGPMDIPTVGRMALIADPQGAHIWLFKPAM
jgi:predicted enzyme related to lactoylglutathione lyase